MSKEDCAMWSMIGTKIYKKCAQVYKLEEENERLEAELEQHRWIPVSERLPEKTEEDLRPEFLVYDGESVTGALWRHYDFGWDFETDRGEPTHWKPIIIP